MNWYWIYGSGVLSGGLVLRLLDYLIAWSREKREQKAANTAREKDRPRFRVDTTVREGSHPLRPTIIVKILSLGGLPVTVNDGHVAIEASQHPNCANPHQLKGKVISPVAPIEIEFPFKQIILQPGRPEESTVKLVCKFSYDGDQEYTCEQTFNRQTDRFE